MSLFVASLNSGSNGNCYYIGNRAEGILVDAGISCRETERRLKRLELSIKKIKAIFVTHEHTDHIYGIPRLSKKHHIPIYITNNTLSGGRLHLREDLVFAFSAYTPIPIGDLCVTPFPIYHDACDPHCFMISGNNVTVGVFTDIGILCNHVRSILKNAMQPFSKRTTTRACWRLARIPLVCKTASAAAKGICPIRRRCNCFSGTVLPL